MVYKCVSERNRCRPIKIIIISKWRFQLDVDIYMNQNSPEYIWDNFSMIFILIDSASLKFIIIIIT